MRKRVMVVDDNPANCEILSEILSPEYEVAVAGDGPECFAKAGEFGPDVVLLDVMMPGMDGYAVCRELKAAPCGELTQVLLVSACSSRDARMAGYEAGADDYIVKPFDHEELLAKVRVQFRMRDTLLELAKTRGQLAVQNNRLDALARQRAAQIVETQDIAVFALAKLAESRDTDTGKHLERMREYSQIIAQELAKEGPYQQEIDAAFLDDLYRSSPLHDIGKVGVADNILLKPGKLTPEEFALMKQHAVIGAAALESAIGHARSGGFLAMGAAIARHHHERFDGRGYPDGLAGLAIPLAARIVSVADVFDALTSVRVYKPAFDPDRARAMIAAESGKQFDAAVVEAFQRSWDQILAARATLSDSESCDSDASSQNAAVAGA